MAKFSIVKEAPLELSAGEYLIDKPNFLSEIEQHRSKGPKNGLTAPFHLRMILDSISQNYDPENMTAYSIKVHLYEGRPFSSDQELSDILVEAIKDGYPSMFTKYLDKKIKTRPKNINMVYYVESKIPFTYETFYQNGLDDASDIERAQRREQEALEKQERSDKWRKQQEIKKQKENNDNSN